MLSVRSGANALIIGGAVPEGERLIGERPMERTPPPGQQHEPEVTNDAPDDVRGYRPRVWNLIRLGIGSLIVLLIMSTLVWLTGFLDVIAEFLPGGLLWAGVGLLGLLILGWWLWTRARSSGSRR